MEPVWVTNSPELLKKAQNLANDAGVTLNDGVAYLAWTMEVQRSDPSRRKVHPALCPLLAPSYLRAQSSPALHDADCSIRSGSACSTSASQVLWQHSLTGLEQADLNQFLYDQTQEQQQQSHSCSQQHLDQERQAEQLRKPRRSRVILQALLNWRSRDAKNCPAA